LRLAGECRLENFAFSCEPLLVFTSWRTRLRAALFAAATTLVFTQLFAMEALARPGGGGSFHSAPPPPAPGGGGFHAGGIPGGVPSFGPHSGGGSIGPFGVIFLLLFLAVFIAIAVARARRGLANLQFDPSAAARPSVSLDILRARDPGLTEESIVAHVRPMADMLRGAWSGGDMRPARAFVSDGVFSRFQVQLALMVQENRRNVMSDARVLVVTIEAVEDAAPLDVVHVRMTAEARDTEVPMNASPEQIQRALSQARVKPYTEVWSLVRRSGAQTKSADFAVGRACPSCGAPLDQGEIIKCKYCQALVCSGEHDWVLAEITQLEEWRGLGLPPPGLDVLKARDPGSAREVLKDRASFLFWKWVQAGRAGAVVPLRKYAAAGFLASGAHLDWTQGAVDIAVGGAEVFRCDVGASDGTDRAHVAVTWSARFGGSRSFTTRRTAMVLARKSGVVSRLSMTSLVCQACGAPLVESDSTRCDHCGTELAAGDQAWVLEAVVPL
jgi:uncharacterized membrane protein